MSEAIIRTEDINPKLVRDFFVETEVEREIINSLKGKQPVLVVGSRGTGKTMLLRMAERELSDAFEEKKNLPVFVNLATCNIHDSNNILKILISRSLIALQHALRAHGIRLSGSIFKPITDISVNPIVNKLEKYINTTSEEANCDSDVQINDELIKHDVAKLIEFLNEICEEFSISCITFFFDEACQVFQPTHQRMFFDYFRALRSYNIACKAAVYPGIVTYGTLQKFHDATVKTINRSITSDGYIKKMREIIQKHFPEDYPTFEKQGELLDTIILASSGNPRFLLKSLNEIIAGQTRLSSKNTITKIKEFYGTTIWTEHIKLGEMYSGHKDMINWARNFLEDVVLADIEKINTNPESKSTIFFCISRNAPEVVKQSIKTLEYSGIVSLHTEGTKYRTEMYDRYETNLGIVVLFEKQAVINKRIKEIADSISIKLFPNYGKNSSAYGDISALKDISNYEANSAEIIKKICENDISSLEISLSIQKRLHDNGINTIGQILNKSEAQLMEIKYIGLVRSRKIANIVYNAILEYISG